ncbi:CPS_collapsed_G0027900.mRNA.1.CDS.1 [Saccharomyces cerevisiae]|nr:CPS_collapsed_G0027900.mRNA.1.CDS.1 [Saccharomyces cerevisiae]
MTAVRRSTRIRTKSQVIEEDYDDEQNTSAQHVESDKITAKTQHEEEEEQDTGESEESSSEDDYEDQDDDDYVDTATAKRKSRKRKPKSASNTSSKRQKKKPTSAQKSAKELFGEVIQAVITRREEKRPNNKTLEKLESTIAETQGSKVVIDSIIDNIVKLCFVHRYKDVSDLIRSESMLHLSIWIKNYPEYFLKVTFLKYFGWLLSDNSVSVRLQVTKILPHLIIQNHNSKSTDNSAIRQVFERFKTKILEVAIRDVNLDVRDPHLMFDEEFDPFKTSSFNKRSKFLSTVAKFLARVIKEKFDEFIKTHEDLPKEVDGLEVGPVDKDPYANTSSRVLSPYISTHLKTICNLLISDTESNELIQKLQNSANNNSDDDDVDDEELDITPLFPIDRNSTILYLNVFHGLCAGANNPKIQTKDSVKEIVLPLFYDLLNAASIESADILCPLLERLYHIFSG